MDSKDEKEIEQYRYFTPVGLEVDAEHWLEALAEYRDEISRYWFVNDNEPFLLEHKFYGKVPIGVEPPLIWQVEIRTSKEILAISFRDKASSQNGVFACGSLRATISAPIAHQVLLFAGGVLTQRFRLWPALA